MYEPEFYDPADDLDREERAAERIDVLEGSASYARAAEAAWARRPYCDDPGDVSHTHGVFIPPVPVRTPRYVMTARPRKVSWRELARDIFADLKVKFEHKEDIARW